MNTTNITLADQGLVGDIYRCSYLKPQWAMSRLPQNTRPRSLFAFFESDPSQLLLNTGCQGNRGDHQTSRDALENKMVTLIELVPTLSLLHTRYCGSEEATSDSG